MDILNKLKNKALMLTDKPGVYLMKNDKEEIIYIGKAKNLKNRVKSYFKNLNFHNEKIKKMVEKIYDFEFYVTISEFEALILECSLIKEYKPKYNILLKDDKGYKYIKITNEDFPKIIVSNRKSNDDCKYIGPYINSYSVKKTVQDVNKIFMLPTCNQNFSKLVKRKRPCLNYYIKNCMGLCCNMIPKKEYSKIIAEAINYLKNGDINYIKKLKDNMEKAAKKEDFENAIKFRDKINAIMKISQNQNVRLDKNINAHIISYSILKDELCFVILKIKNGNIYDKENYSFKNITNIKDIREEFIARYYFKNENIPKNIILNFNLENLKLYEEYLSKQAQYKVLIKTPKSGVFKKLTEMAYLNAKEFLTLKEKTTFKENESLKNLKLLLNLKQIPIYIEAYDISNLGDVIIVGAMVVFKNAIPLKKNYRKFKIRTLNKQDDYSAMKEMLKRRIKEYHLQKDESFKQRPDLIFLDGGKNHVTTIMKILEKENFNVPCFGLVKDEKHKTRAIFSSEGEISIKLNNQLFLFLTNIQEEVHRFTISYQKTLHKKNSLKLKICSVNGIGEKKAIKILKNFYKYKNLNINEIMEKTGISQDKAKEIFKILKED